MKKWMLMRCWIYLIRGLLSNNEGFIEEAENDDLRQSIPFGETGIVLEFCKHTFFGWEAMMSSVDQCLRASGGKIWIDLCDIWIA